MIMKLSQAMLSKTITYVKGYDGQKKQMYFLIIDDNLLEKYNINWDKVWKNNLKLDIMQKEVDSEPVYN